MDVGTLRESGERSGLYLRNIEPLTIFSRFPLGIVAPYLKQLKFDIKYIRTRTSCNMLIISDGCAVLLTTLTGLSLRTERRSTCGPIFLHQWRLKIISRWKIIWHFFNGTQHLNMAEYIWFNIDGLVFFVTSAFVCSKYLLLIATEVKPYPIEWR